MEKQLTKQQVSALLNNAPQGLDKKIIIQKLVEKGYTLEGFNPVQSVQETNKLSWKDAGQDLRQIGTDIKDSFQKRTDIVQASKNDPTVSPASTFARTGAQAMGALSDTLGAVTKGVVKVALPQQWETGLRETVIPKSVEAISELTDKYQQLKETKPMMARSLNMLLGFTPDVALGVKDIISGYQKLKETNPKQAQTIDDLLSVGQFALDVATIGEGSSLVKEGTDIAISNTRKGVKKVIDTIPKPPSGGGSGGGVVQIVSDIADRVPRAASRIKENIATASERSAKIKSSSPAIQSAMKSNLDERIINTIDSADDATRKAYRDVVDIAGEQSTKLGTKTQPTKVGGDLAAEQYSIIDKQKKSVGAKLGEETKKLSQNADIEMGDSYSIIDDTLSSQGIMPHYTKKGVKLDFSGSKYTPAERTKIQELYKLATEGGDKLSAKAIREKDQLFSKLKREANFEGVGNIIIDTQNGQRSLFDVFRDVYSSKLDTLSPEIKSLNSQYRKLSNLTDDIESSIFKTPNFQVTKTVDPAEFAKVNLRRIFGESQSSPAYEAIADMMDATSRSLGYKGASPKVVSEFAQEMRKLFPDTIPSTGFSGGIKLGAGDIIEKVTSLGASNLTDKQKAIIELLESYQKATTTKNSIKNDIPVVSNTVKKSQVR